MTLSDIYFFFHVAYHAFNTVKDEEILYPKRIHSEYEKMTICQPDLNLEIEHFKFDLPDGFLFGDILGCILLKWKGFKYWIKHSLLKLPKPLSMTQEKITPKTLDIANLSIKLYNPEIVFREKPLIAKNLIEKFFKNETMRNEQTLFYNQSSHWRFGKGSLLNEDDIVCHSLKCFHFHFSS